MKLRNEVKKNSVSSLPLAGAADFRKVRKIKDSSEPELRCWIQLCADDDTHIRRTRTLCVRDE